MLLSHSTSAWCSWAVICPSSKISSDCDANKLLFSYFYQTFPAPFNKIISCVRLFRVHTFIFIYFLYFLIILIYLKRTFIQNLYREINIIENANL